MTDLSAYILHMRPLGGAVIRDFSDPLGEMFALLTRPPETRVGSFGLRIAAIPQLKNAEYWDLHGQDPFHGRTRRLRVYVDGTVIFRAPADESFLCWPHERTYRFVNPVVVADSAVSFCRFTRLLTELMIRRPESLELGVEIRDAAFSQPPLKFYPGKLRSQGALINLNSDAVHGVNEPSPARNVDFPTAQLLNTAPEDDTQGADAAAFLLVRQLYDVFGYDDATIPYVDRSGVVPRISVKALG